MLKVEKLAVLNVRVKASGRVRPADEVLKAMAKVFGKEVPKEEDIVLYTEEEERIQREMERFHN